MLVVYVHPGCSTCKKALKWLDDHQLQYKVEDIRETRPSAQQMAVLKEKNNYSIHQLFNTSGQEYRKQHLKDKLPTLSTQAALELLASDGMLMKRPIVLRNEKMTVGFKEEVWENVWL